MEGQSKQEAPPDSPNRVTIDELQTVSTSNSIGAQTEGKSGKGTPEKFLGKDKAPPAGVRRSSGVDQGYAWAVLVAAFLLGTLNAGTFVSYGVYLPEYVDYFRVTKAKAAVVSSIGTGLGGLLGIVLGPLVQRVGYQWMAIAGCLVMSVGLATSAATDSLYVLYVTHGIMPGIGLACYNICALLAIMDYFEKKRSMALGLAAGGLSVGIILMPQFNRYLIDKYTWKGALLVYGGYSLNGLVAGALMRPRHRMEKKERATNQVIRERIILSAKLAGKSYAENHTERNAVDSMRKDTKEMFPNERTLSNCKRTKCSQWASVLDISILRNVKASLLYISVCCSMAGHVIPYIFIPARMMSYKVETTRATLVISIMGITGGVGRPLAGVLGDYLRAHRALLMTASSVLTGSMCVVSYFITDYITSAVIFGSVGVLCGGYIALQAAVLGDVLPRHQLPQGTGFLITTYGVAIISSPPIAGWLVDVSKDFATPFLFFGLVQILGGFFSSLVFLLQQRRGRHGYKTRQQTEPPCDNNKEKQTMELKPLNTEADDS